VGGSNGKGQSGQVTMPMGTLLAVRVAPTMYWRRQRSVNALVDGLESLGC